MNLRKLNGFEEYQYKHMEYWSGERDEWLPLAAFYETLPDIENLSFSVEKNPKF